MSIKKNISGVLYASCIALALSIVSTPAYAKSFFVSPSGSNASGTSWAEAWNELDKINWEVVNPGDRIIIDGGKKQTVYHTTMVVNKSGMPNNPISIVQSRNPKHSGQIVISGVNNPRGSSSGIPLHSQQANHPPGIEINSSNVRILANRRCGFKVTEHAFVGVRINNGVKNIVLSNMEIDNNGLSIWHADYGGLIVNGGGHRFFNLNVHDNAGRNVIRNRRNFDSSPSRFRTCWIYNENNKFSDGIDFRSDNPQDDGASATGLDRVSYCAFGPGLVNGLRFLGNSGGISVKESLFLNAHQRNFSASSRNQNTKIILRNITSFTTPINPLGLRSRCERFYGTVGCYDIFYPRPNSRGNIGGGGSEQWLVKNSIFYGGYISISTEKVLKTKNNFQFNVQGNTTAVDDQLIDPRFKQDVASIANDISFEDMANTRFSLSRKSSAIGAGSRYLIKANMLRCKR